MHAREGTDVTTLLNVIDRLPPISVPAGQILLSEGERTGLLYVLIDGAVEVLKGDVSIDTVDEPGAIFGEISALIDIPHMATVKTVTSSRVVRIERAAEFLHTHSDVAIEVARLLAERLNNVTGYLVDLKRQFEGHGHLGMVDEVLESLVHQQRQSFTPGSNRDPDSET